MKNTKIFLIGLITIALTIGLRVSMIDGNAYADDSGYIIPKPPQQKPTPMPPLPTPENHLAQNNWTTTTTPPPKPPEATYIHDTPENPTQENPTMNNEQNNDSKKEEFARILNSTTRQAEPTNAPNPNGTGNRSASEYSKVIEQFWGNPPQLKTYPRYVQDGNTTYCNIFAWDVTRAMGAEIPHWVITATGASGVDADGKLKVSTVNVDGKEVKKCFVAGEYKECKELQVNPTVEWLNKHGMENGWFRVQPATLAQQKAMEGHPTIAIWKNPTGEGHIAIVRPGTPGDSRGAATAQAGLKDLTLNATHIGAPNGFDPEFEKNIMYWCHE